VAYWPQPKIFDWLDALATPTGRARNSLITASNGDGLFAALAGTRKLSVPRLFLQNCQAIEANPEGNPVFSDDLKCFLESRV